MARDWQLQWTVTRHECAGPPPPAAAERKEIFLDSRATRLVPKMAFCSMVDANSANLILAMMVRLPLKFVLGGPAALCVPRCLKSGQVRFITWPKSRTMRATRQLMLPPSTVS